MGDLTCYGACFQERGRLVVRALGQFLLGGCFVDFLHLGLLLLVGSLELQQHHSLRHTYYMNAQDKYHGCT